MIETSRSGQVSWIEKNDEGGYFDSLNSRIECFTELSLKTAEAYQIVNYGLSGHYVPHHDAFKKQYVRIISCAHMSYSHHVGGDFEVLSP